MRRTSQPKLPRGFSLEPRRGSREPRAVNLVRFKHARFSARFPDSYRYSRSHYWIAPAGGEPGLWRVGFTKFATRMLGELVEAQFKAYPLTPRLRCTSGGGCGAREAEGNS